jgi:hypothetical protein
VPSPADDGSSPSSADGASASPPPVPPANLPPAAAQELAEVVRDAEAAAAALPPAVRDVLTATLRLSADRVSSSFAAGRIDGEEAVRAAHMLDEMVDALLALERGAATVTSSDGYQHSDLVAREVKTTDGDVLRIGVRPSATGGGQARVKIENVVDDGAALERPDRLMIRLDLEEVPAPTASAVAVLDLQFGHENPRRLAGAQPLDMRVHGVLLDDGVPRLNRGGRPLADHHFRVGGDGDLDDPAAFARFAKGFLDDLERDAGGAP